MIANYLQDRLRRELELSKKSVQRGIAEWEETCREIKITELREELQVNAVPNLN